MTTAEKELFNAALEQRDEHASTRLLKAQRAVKRERVRPDLFERAVEAYRRYVPARDAWVACEEEMRAGDLIEGVDSFYDRVVAAVQSQPPGLKTKCRLYHADGRVAEIVVPGVIDNDTGLLLVRKRITEDGKTFVADGQDVDGLIHTCIDAESAFQIVVHMREVA